MLWGATVDTTETLREAKRTAFETHAIHAGHSGVWAVAEAFG